MGTEPGVGRVAAVQQRGLRARSRFWTHFSGGLNYQVAHHLFPGVCHCYYPDITPVIMKVAKEHGLEYCVYPTFWSALSAHFRHLKNVGQKAYVPSLQTVG